MSKLNIKKNINSLWQVLKLSEQKGSHLCYLNKSGSHNIWEKIDIVEFKQNILAIAKILKKEGVKKGTMVGIFAPSSPQWLMVDFAIQTLGAISVPFYANICDENFDYQLKQTNTQFLFLATDEKHKHINAKYKTFFKKIITFGVTKKYPKSISLQKCLQTKVTEDEIDDFYKLPKNFSKSQTSTIVYTSGSTGFPKGVILSHENILKQVQGADACFDVHSNDKVLSCLPLAHIFERAVMYYYISSGANIYFADDLKNVGHLMRDVKPTVTTLVPRFLEKVYLKMLGNVMESEGIKKIIGSAAFNRAVKNDPTKKKQLIDKVFDKMVYKKLRHAMGDHLRLVVAGGAALSDDLYRFFLNIGVPVYQGYGMTENAPVIASNYPQNNKVGTVGKAFPDVQVKTLRDGEIVVKGASLMQGYYKNPKETKQTIVKGWLRTGDKGEIDKEGFIKIIGRKKELYKTSGGKYINPVLIEDKLKAHPFIDIPVVIGENKNFVSCLLFVEPETLEKLETKYSLVLDNKETIEDSGVLSEIEAFITQVNQKLDRWEQIKKFKLFTFPLTVESGELTPKMSLYRKKIEDKFSKFIDEFYK